MPLKYKYWTWARAYFVFHFFHCLFFRLAVNLLLVYVPPQPVFIHYLSCGVDMNAIAQNGKFMHL